MQRAGSAPGQTSSLVHPVCVPHTKRQALLFILLDEKKASPSQASCSKKPKVPATLAPASQLNCIKKTFNINSPDKQAAEFAQANSSPEMAHSTGGPWPSRTVCGRIGAPMYFFTVWVPWSFCAKISRTHHSSQFFPSTLEPPPNCFLVFQVPLPSPAEMLMKCECTRMGLLGNLTGLLPSPCSLIKLLLREDGSDCASFCPCLQRALSDPSPWIYFSLSIYQ